MKFQNYIYKSALVILSAVYLTSCGTEAKQQSAGELSTPVQVKVATVSTEGVDNASSYSAEIKSTSITQLSTKLMGRIYQFNYEAGDVVKKGGVIARIESAGIESAKARVHAQVEMAEVGLKNAEKDYNRITKLHELGSATDKELDDITTHYLSAKAGLESAQKAEEEVNANLSYTVIKAPFNGVITRKYMTQGDMASPGMPVVEFASSDQFKALASIPESEIDLFEVGEEAQLYVGAVQKTIQGKVKRVVPSGKYNGGQFQVEFDIQPTEGITNGMYAKVATANGQTDKILVPQSAILYKGQLTGVYLVNLQGEASLTWVRLGNTYEDKVEVLSGVQSGDKVIVTLMDQLHDGKAVKF